MIFQLQTHVTRVERAAAGAAIVQMSRDGLRVGDCRATAPHPGKAPGSARPFVAQGAYVLVAHTPCAGSIVLATQPASRQHRARDRFGGEQRVVEAAQAQADDQHHGQAQSRRSRRCPSRRRAARRSRRRLRRPRQSARTSKRSGAVRRMALRSIVRPSSAAAMCGAHAASNWNGPTSASVNGTGLPASRSARTSSLTRCPSIRVVPAATGLKPARPAPCAAEPVQQRRADSRLADLGVGAGDEAAVQQWRHDHRRSFIAPLPAPRTSCNTSCSRVRGAQRDAQPRDADGHGGRTDRRHPQALRIRAQPPAPARRRCRRRSAAGSRWSIQRGASPGPGAAAISAPTCSRSSCQSPKLARRASPSAPAIRRRLASTACAIAGGARGRVDVGACRLHQPVDHGRVRSHEGTAHAGRLAECAHVDETLAARPKCDSAAAAPARPARRSRARRRPPARRRSARPASAARTVGAGRRPC